MDKNVIIKPPSIKHSKRIKSYQEVDGKIIWKFPIRKTKPRGSLGLGPIENLGIFDNLVIRTNPEGLEAFWQYKNFQEKYQLEPGFYIDVLKKAMKLEWFKGHRRELAYLILLDIFHPQMATLQEANEYYEEEQVDKDVSRQRRLLRSKYYPELFFKHPKDLIQIDPVYKPEGNVSYFSSVSMEVPVLE